MIIGKTFDEEEAGLINVPLLLQEEHLAEREAVPVFLSPLFRNNHQKQIFTQIEN
jgi:hypothetical protein